MKRIARSLLLLAVAVTLTPLPCVAESSPMATPVHPFAQSNPVKSTADFNVVAEFWQEKLSSSPEWRPFVTACGAENALPEGILLRLLATCYLDFGYSNDNNEDIRPSNIALYTPAFQAVSAQTPQRLRVEAITFDGKVTFAVDTVSGAVTMSDAEKAQIESAKAITFAKVVEQWRKAYAETDDWAALMELQETETAISAETFVRLVISYYMDTDASLTLKQIADFAPRFKRESVGGVPCLVMNSFTIQGDVKMTLNIRTGELMDCVIGSDGLG